MSKDTKKPFVGLPGIGLDELNRHGARQVIQPAVAAELAKLIERFASARTVQARGAVICNGELAGSRGVDGRGAN